MKGKMLGVFSSSYEGFYLKWEPNQNFENSAHFDENFQIMHIGPYRNIFKIGTLPTLPTIPTFATFKAFRTFKN